MEVYPANRPFYLIEADVVESLEARAGDRPDPVIGYEEVFLPPHEDVVPLRPVSESEVWVSGILAERSPRWKSRPVVEICFFGCAPGRVSGYERVLRTDHFSFKVGRQCWVVLRKTCKKGHSKSVYIRSWS